MSDSGETDILLEIPPDLFVVASSSDSDSGCDRRPRKYGPKNTGVISELVGHMQTLENRISAIESKDNSLDATLMNNSLESHMQGSMSLLTRHQQTLQRGKLPMSQTASLQNSPVKPCQFLSLPSTPSGCSVLERTNNHRNEFKLGLCLPGSQANATNVNNTVRNRLDLESCSDYPVVPGAYSRLGSLHATSSLAGDHCTSTSKLLAPVHESFYSVPAASDLRSATTCRLQPRTVQDMNISEVDELLQKMEFQELEVAKKINSVNSHHHLQDHRDISSLTINSNNHKAHNGDITQNCGTSKKLEFHGDSLKFEPCDLMAGTCLKRMDIYPDISLPYATSFQSDENSKLISEFKPWEESNVESTFRSTENACDRPAFSKSSTARVNESTTEQNPIFADNDNTILSSDEASKYKPTNQGQYREHNSIHMLEPNREPRGMSSRHTTQDVERGPLVKHMSHASTNTDFQPRIPQKLLSLSDFWDNNTNKSQEELLRIKLEEEKFRREHCEHLIQELQKRLLEQQEKVAVALRVDNSKNDLIGQLHSVWSKLKERAHNLDTEREKLQTDLKNITEKHQAEIAEFQAQIKRSEGELSKALDLAAGYKEKSDETMKEKLDLLKNHADELESCQSLTQEAENRYEQMKAEYNKLLEKHQQTEEMLKNLQQELNKERLRGGEVRNEMNVIHNALDTCEAELTILRQEKENLQLKLKEEVNRNAILEQRNIALITSLNDAKQAEKLAKDETKSVAEQKEKIRTELQEVYQKQVDEVVKVKLQEFQTQLDAAESEFLEELKNRQQVIAECAARKIKDIMDKHRLEINLLEEKHKEEKRLSELQLAQAHQKVAIFETQLNSQRTAKSHLAEQLHSVMQKQWQQALQIISGGNTESLTPLQRIHAEKFFDARGPRKSESLPNCYAKMSQDPSKLPNQPSEMKNFYAHLQREDHNDTRSTMTSIEDTPLTSRKEAKDDLRKYIRMIAEMQQPREEFVKIRETMSSPPLTCREVPRKHYTKKELSIMSEDSVTWQPVPESSSKESADFDSGPQKDGPKLDQKCKPPWK